MSELEATAVRCPECNAVLHVQRGSSTATCEYCGTSARIQRRTKVLLRPQPLPPRADHEPVAIAIQVKKMGLLSWLSLLFTIVAIGVPIYGVVRAIHAGRQWMGGPPLVADCDGDGVDDVIGLVRNVHADEITLAAFSGASGDKLWETASLGNYDTVRHAGAPALAGSVVLRRDTHGRLYGYDLATGALRWQARADDAIDRLCTGSAPGELAIRSATGTWSTLALATGALQPATAPSTCHGIMAANDHALEAEVVAADRVRVQGMAVQTVVAQGDGPRIAIGLRSPGTAMAMIAAVDAAGATRWKAFLPTDDRLVATLELHSIALDDRDVAVVYWHSSPIAPELAVFDRATGQRRFDASLDKQTSTANGIALTRTAVAVSQWGNLQLFDRVTGRALHTIP